MAETRRHTLAPGAECTTARHTLIYAHGAMQSSACRMCLEPLITAHGRRGRYQEDRSEQVVENSFLFDQEVAIRGGCNVACRRCVVHVTATAASRQPSLAGVAAHSLSGGKLKHEWNCSLMRFLRVGWLADVVGKRHCGCQIVQLAL